MVKNDKMDKNIDNFNEFKDLMELQAEIAKLNRENKALYKTIDKLIGENKKKSEEISHLKGLLEKSVPVLIENVKPQQKIKFEVSAEEEIAEIQLQKLREEARKRTLTLEETRQFDLLVKNKRLSQQQSTINLDSSQYKKLNDEKLLEIASSSDRNDTKS